MARTARERAKRECTPPDRHGGPLFDGLGSFPGRRARDPRGLPRGTAAPVTRGAFPEALRRGSLGGVLPLRPELFDVPGAALPADACEATVRREFGGVSWGCGDPARARADVAWVGDGAEASTWYAVD